LKAKGYEMGNSLLDESAWTSAGSILEQGRREGVEAASAGGCGGSQGVTPPMPSTKWFQQGNPADWEGLDIGPEDSELFKNAVKMRPQWFGTAPWVSSNLKPSPRVPMLLPKRLAESSAITIIGGGDSAAAVEQIRAWPTG
jgi:phosphoglycerate kinase